MTHDEHPFKALGRAGFGGYQRVVTRSAFRCEEYGERGLEKGRDGLYYVSRGVKDNVLWPVNDGMVQPMVRGVKRAGAALTQPVSKKLIKNPKKKRNKYRQLEQEAECRVQQLYPDSGSTSRRRRKADSDITRSPTWETKPRSRKNRHRDEYPPPPYSEYGDSSAISSIPSRPKTDEDLVDPRNVRGRSRGRGGGGRVENWVFGQNDGSMPDPNGHQSPPASIRGHDDGMPQTRKPRKRIARVTTSALGLVGINKAKVQRQKLETYKGQQRKLDDNVQRTHVTLLNETTLVAEKQKGNVEKMAKIYEDAVEAFNETTRNHPYCKCIRAWLTPPPLSCDTG
jgi:hypothetical protein